MDEKPPSDAGVLGKRPSKTALAMFEAKLKRVAALSPRERMLLALRLGRELKALEAESKR